MVIEYSRGDANPETQDLSDRLQALPTPTPISAATFREATSYHLRVSLFQIIRSLILNTRTVNAAADAWARALRISGQ